MLHKRQRERATTESRSVRGKSEGLRYKAKSQVHGEILRRKKAAQNDSGAAAERRRLSGTAGTLRMEIHAEDVKLEGWFSADAISNFDEWTGGSEQGYRESFGRVRAKG